MSKYPSCGMVPGLNMPLGGTINNHPALTAKSDYYMKSHSNDTEH